MQIRPEFKSVKVSFSGRFDPQAVTPSSLARHRLFPKRHADSADIHHHSPGLSWFTAANFRVRVLPGQFDAESWRPPYRPLRDLTLGALERMPDRVAVGLFIDRRFDFPVRRTRDFDHIALALLENGPFFRSGDAVRAVDFQPDQRADGCRWVFVRPSRFLEEQARPGISVEVSDRYLGGSNPASSTNLLAGILKCHFQGSVKVADEIVDRVIANWN